MMMRRLLGRSTLLTSSVIGGSSNLEGLAKRPSIFDKLANIRDSGSLGIDNSIRGRSIYSTFGAAGTTKGRKETGKLSIGYPMECYEQGCKFPPTRLNLHGFFEMVDANCNLNGRPVDEKKNLPEGFRMELVNEVIPKFIERMYKVVYAKSEKEVIEIMLNMWIDHGCKTPYGPVEYYETSLTLYETYGCGGLLEFLWNKLESLRVEDVDKSKDGCIGVKGHILRKLILEYFNALEEMMVEVRSDDRKGYHAFKDVLLGFDLASKKLLKEKAKMSRMRGSLNWGRGKKEFVYLLLRPPGMN